MRVFHGTLSAADIASHFDEPGNSDAKDAQLVLSYSFADGKATDASENKNDGVLAGARPTEGKVAGAMRFSGRQAQQGGGSFVSPSWKQDVPLLVRAMVMADKTLFIAGPPDLINEEETFKQLTEDDPKVAELLAKQDAALKGAQGGVLMAISSTDGKRLGELKLPSLPTWDGMAAADGKLFLSTTDGRVLCLGAP